MKKFLVAAVVVIALGYGCLNYHFILTDNSFKILKKTSPTLDHTFVDARGMNKLKLLADPDLVAAGIKDLIGK